MKTIYFILIALLMEACCLLPDSCPPETTYKLINATSYKITIKPFGRKRAIVADTLGNFTGDFDIAEVIFLNPNETKIFLRERFDQRQYYAIESVDSLRIIFDNKKIRIETCNAHLHKDTCSDLTNSASINYTFTEQDYLDAEDCQGECE